MSAVPPESPQPVPAATSETPDTPDTLDALVGRWLTLPDVAEELGIDVGKVRRQVSERYLVGVRRGERNTFQVPAAFLVPADPAEASGARAQVLASLRGTVLVLSDVGFTDTEILRWLFEQEDSIGAAPVEALRAGRKHEVRRVAQALA